MMESASIQIRKIVIEFIPRESSVLEIGYGKGYFALDLWKKKIKRYIGIDLLPSGHRFRRQRIGGFRFITGNIFNNIDLLDKCDTIVAIEVFEHIRRDFDLLTLIPRGKKVIFSVPNSPFKKEHKRWFELEGWKDRYKDIFNFEEEFTVSHPTKKEKRAFIFITTKK